MKATGPNINKDFGGFDRPRALFSNLPVGLDPLCDYHIFFDDFLNEVSEVFEAGTTDPAVTKEWEIVKDSSATVALTANAENGEILLSSAATTDDDGALIQMKQTSFLVKAGKKLWFEARVKVSDADQCDMFVGLADTAATDPEAVVAEGLARVGFELADGSANILCVTDNDTAATKTDSGVDAGDATYVRLGFRTDGGHVRFYINRALVHSVAIPTAIAAVTLGPAFFGLSGNDTGTHTRAMDYILAVQER